MTPPSPLPWNYCKNADGTYTLEDKDMRSLAIVSRYQDVKLIDKAVNAYPLVGELVKVVEQLVRTSPDEIARGKAQQLLTRAQETLKGEAK